MADTACERCGVAFDRASRRNSKFCDECRRIRRNEYALKYRRRQAAMPYDPSARWHGTITGYSTRGCKCAPCRDAGLGYLREWNKRPEVKARRHAANRNAELQARYALNRRSYMYRIDKAWLQYLEGETRCWACGDEPGERLHVDHDHACCAGQRSCGKCFRGMLCRRCNMALGLLRDDPQVLASLVDYLARNAELVEDDLG